MKKTKSKLIRTNEEYLGWVVLVDHNHRGHAYVDHDGEDMSFLADYPQYTSNLADCQEFGNSTTYGDFELDDFFKEGEVYEIIGYDKSNCRCEEDLDELEQGNRVYCGDPECIGKPIFAGTKSKRQCLTFWRNKKGTRQYERYEPEPPKPKKRIVWSYGKEDPLKKVEPKKGIIRSKRGEKKKREK